jgi:hypothetical protein
MIRILTLGPYPFQTRGTRMSQVLEDLGSGHYIIHGDTADRDHHQQPQDIDAEPVRRDAITCRPGAEPCRLSRL